MSYLYQFVRYAVKDMGKRNTCGRLFAFDWIGLFGILAVKIPIDNLGVSTQNM